MNSVRYRAESAVQYSEGVYVCRRDPTPAVSALLERRWPRLDATRLALHIGTELSVTRLAEAPRVRVWRDLYCRYRRQHNTATPDADRV